MEHLEKINELKKIFKNLDTTFAREMEEKVDLQYFVLNNLRNSMKNDEMFLKLVLINSLVSYQLCTTGELWWEEFSNYWSKTSVDNFSFKEKYVDFLKNSKGNRRLLDAKIKRIEKISSFLESVNLLELEKYYENMENLLLKISKELKSKKESKTIVFAVKMFGYASRIVFKKFIPYPMEIPIPNDTRIEKYTKKFSDKNPIAFWDEISKDSKIPPLHIDSIIWPALGRNFDCKRCIENIGEKSKYILKLMEI